MTEEKGSAEELARLQRDRDDADRRYNAALTNLDAAIDRPRESPSPPRPYDEFQITALNERWDLLSLKPDAAKGWLSGLRVRMWAMVAPLFERQQAFNSALVDHVNRNIAVHRETTRALESTLAMYRDDHQRLVEFQTRLIVYAQQMTPYIDTRDRHVAGLMHGLSAGLSAVADELQKRWESMVARERRFDAKVTDLQRTVGVMQRAVQTLKREMESRTLAPGAPMAPGAPVVPGSQLDSYKYVGFEDQFRGSSHDIRERLNAYVPLFEGASDVLDVGCGRGEFLELLRTAGVTARGVELNEEMAALCREQQLDVATQDVEHFQPEYLIRFLETAYHKLRPGAKIVLETINPACWFAFFSSYIRDITHVRPLHPDTLQYLLSASGFQNVSVRYSAPFPEEYKLQSLAEAKTAPGETPALEAAFNENVKKLNSLLFTYLDYAAIGERF